MKLIFARYKVSTLLIALCCMLVLGGGFAVASVVNPMTSSASSTQPILRYGSRGQAVKTVQRQLGGLAIDGSFGPKTLARVKQFQRNHGLVVDGIVGPITWSALLSSGSGSGHGGSNIPSSVDQRSIYYARHEGWAIDASKNPGYVRVLRYNGRHVVVTMSVRASFGDSRGSGYATPDGVWRVFRKGGENCVSNAPGLKGAPMPYCTTFVGGDAFHYDPLFPYSHGCVHIPSMSAAKYIHDLPYGTAVVVHE